jgi:hypothetical protein
MIIRMARTPIEMDSINTVNHADMRIPLTMRRQAVAAAATMTSTVNTLESAAGIPRLENSWPT